jgi:hypothetical protein
VQRWSFGGCFIVVVFIVIGYWLVVTVRNDTKLARVQDTIGQATPASTTATPSGKPGHWETITGNSEWGKISEDIDTNSIVRTTDGRTRVVFVDVQESTDTVAVETYYCPSPDSGPYGTVIFGNGYKGQPTFGTVAYAVMARVCFDVKPRP